MPASLKDATWPSSDSTSPILLAKILEHEEMYNKLLETLSNDGKTKHQEEIEKLSRRLKKMDPENDVVKILGVVPLFNEEIETKAWVKDFSRKASSEEIDFLFSPKHYIITGLCPLYDVEGKVTTTIKHAIHKNVSCQGDTRHGGDYSDRLSKKWCPNVQDMYRIAAHIDEYLSTQSRLRLLQPKLDLIGSMTEGTRCGQADELDINVSFSSLEGDSAFAKLSSAYDLQFTENGLEVVREADLQKHLVKSGNKFNYPAFLLMFVEEIKQAIKIIQKEEKFSHILFNTAYSLDDQSCQDCNELRRKTTDDKFKHCRMMSSCANAHKERTLPDYEEQENRGH